MPRTPGRPSGPEKTERETDVIQTRLNIMLDETTTNERALALGRLMFCVVGAVQSRLQPTFTEAMAEGRRVLVVCFLLGALHSLALLQLIRRGRYHSRLGYLSVMVDTSLITGGLCGLIVAGLPELAADSPVAVPLYLLAVAIAGLRYNHRLTVLASVVSAIQYLSVIALAAPEQLLPDSPSWMTHIAQLLLIFCAGLVATFGVRRSRELRTAAILDALTGVYNRGFLEERLRTETERAARYQRNLAFAMFDVDHFKAYNDTYGHPAGDLALQQVARLLRDGLRRTDTVARYGGEEFVALLPETGRDQALLLLDRLREQIAAHPFELPGPSEPARLTISIGVACLPDDADSAESLRQHADDAVYRAKASGRNCVRG